ncbi:MAG TPA: TetR family transcriptional regulator C-terminal domain-containing protein [Microbacterium sp.]|nr:TetR family transcriptional regulator C-terminal domain-containing protein [Microbacterium sp.]
MSSIRTRRSAGERIAEIGDAARAIALESGLSAVTLRGVAQHMGVASGLVAHYAPSMNDLVAETFAAIVGAELTELRQLAGDQDGHSGALVAVLGSMLDEGRADVTLVWVQSWALGGRNPALAESVREQMDLWRSFLAGLLADGHAAGEFRCDHPTAIAGQVLGMIDGLNAHSLVGWQRPRERTELLMGSVESMLGLSPGALIDRMP